MTSIQILYYTIIKYENNKLIIRQNKTKEKQLNGQDFNCDTINKIFVNIVFTFLLKPN